MTTSHKCSVTNGTTLKAARIPTTSRLPRKIHFIWFQGANHVPPQFITNVEDWQRAHPKWEIKIWDEKLIVALFRHIQQIVPAFIDAFHNLDLMIKKIDVARFVILYVEGGIYMDLDMRYVKGSLDDVFRRYKQDLVLCATDHLTPSNTLMASAKGHSFWIHCMKRQVHAAGNVPWLWQVVMEEMNIWYHTGPAFVQSCYQTWLAENNLCTEEVGVIGRDYFFPTSFLWPGWVDTIWQGKRDQTKTVGHHINASLWARWHTRPFATFSAFANRNVHILFSILLLLYIVANVIRPESAYIVVYGAIPLLFSNLSVLFMTCVCRKRNLLDVDLSSVFRFMKQTGHSLGIMVDSIKIK